MSRSNDIANITASVLDGVTAAEVGLGNVTNESKATMFASPTFTGDVSATNIKHSSSGSNNLVLGSDGSSNIDGLKVKDSALVTDTNKYAFTGSGELNSKGYLKNNFFGACYYLNADLSVSHNTHTEVNGTWVAFASVSGVSSNDPFARFNQPSSGRWQPTVAGFYLVSYSLKFESIDDQSIYITSVIKNGVTDATGAMTAFQRDGSSGNTTIISSACGIIPLDINDYVSLYAYQNTGGTRNVGPHGHTTIGFCYIGETL